MKSEAYNEECYKAFMRINLRSYNYEKLEKISRKMGYEEEWKRICRKAYKAIFHI